MKVAIVSNGPSAIDYDPSAGWDLRIGVHTQCLKHEFDWVVSMDGTAFGAEYQAGATSERLCDEQGNGKWLGHPSFFIGNPGYQWLQNNRLDVVKTLAGHYLVLWPKGATWYSGPASLLLCGLLGIHSVHLFGFDLTGPGGDDGLQNPSRTPSRWERERQLVRDLIRDHAISVENEVQWLAASTSDCPDSKP
jgi:hypothetical protein